MIPAFFALLCFALPCSSLVYSRQKSHFRTLEVANIDLQSVTAYLHRIIPRNQKNLQVLAFVTCYVTYIVDRSAGRFQLNSAPDTQNLALLFPQVYYDTWMINDLWIHELLNITLGKAKTRGFSLVKELICFYAMSYPSAPTRRNALQKRNDF